MRKTVYKQYTLHICIYGEHTLNKTVLLLLVVVVVVVVKCYGDILWL